jgi:hypothetical protein
LHCGEHHDETTDNKEKVDPVGSGSRLRQYLDVSWNLTDSVMPNHHQRGNTSQVLNWKEPIGLGSHRL